MSIARTIVRTFFCMPGLWFVDAAASEHCSISGASYAPIGQASEEGWLIEFGAAGQFDRSFAALISGPFEGSPIEFKARFGTIGGWPYHIERAPVAFFDEHLEPANPYKIAPHYMFVHHLDATLAYRLTKGMTIGLGAPMWQLAECEAN